MEKINELLKFYEQNEDFKTYVDKCVKTYGKDVNFMLHTPIAYEYYKQLRGDKKMIGSLGSPDLDAAYDRWKTTPPEPAESKFKCDKCGEEFYPDDPVYECDCENLCKDCALEWLNDKRHFATWEQCYGDD